MQEVMESHEVELDGKTYQVKSGELAGVLRGCVHSYVSGRGVGLCDLAGCGLAPGPEARACASQPATHPPTHLTHSTPTQCAT